MSDVIKSGENVQPHSGPVRQKRKSRNGHFKWPWNCDGRPRRDDACSRNTPIELARGSVANFCRGNVCNTEIERNLLPERIS